MDHDPFCRAYYPDLTEPERCMWCMVIRRVREDERSKIDLDIEHWIGYNNGYTQGYMDGYSDAEKEFMNPCCFCGHDDFSTYVCDDCKEEEFWNQDIKVIQMSDEDIIKRWNELFDANPWLEGMTHAPSCEFIDCCPVPEPQDWVAFNEVFNLMFLADIGWPDVLTRSFIDEIGGTQ